MSNNKIEIDISNKYKTLNELGSLLEDISKNTTAKILDLGNIPFNLDEKVNDNQTLEKKLEELFTLNKSLNQVLVGGWGEGVNQKIINKVLEIIANSEENNIHSLDVSHLDSEGVKALIAVLKKGTVYDITGTLYSTTSVHWFPRTPEMKKDLLEAIKQNQFITNFKFRNSIDNDLEKEINIITKNNKAKLESLWEQLKLFSEDKNAVELNKYLKLYEKYDQSTLEEFWNYNNKEIPNLKKINEYKNENFLKIAGIGKEGYGDLYILPPEIKHAIFNKISFFDIDYTVNNSQESNVNMLGQEVENI
ncbi:hypothetical protein [Rickettsia endosymbiont of Lasioglossum villosulum]|uniref:hypothetical protein n=1 Tax=Rickettsia endosymbiont of Lasioglossum villosulum TaxID=3066269 RepID=UPI0031332B84